MGCLKSILTSLIKKIIFIALIVAFFAFGGWAFLNQKLNEYKNPTREDFIKTETNYADFSNVSGDYQLTRSYNFFGYKKINAKYLPTGQKITIFDMKNEDRISVKDFETKEIDGKIDKMLDGLKDSFITFENFEIINRGNYYAKNKTIPFIVFKANVKNIPFKTVIGVVAIYSTQNKRAKKPSSKIIYTITDKKAYNPAITKGFISALRF